jgi:hypothetical protein
MNLDSFWRIERKGGYSGQLVLENSEVVLRNITTGSLLQINEK